MCPPAIVPPSSPVYSFSRFNIMLPDCLLSRNNYLATKRIHPLPITRNIATKKRVVNNPTR
jgi:hypothetical protein